jgi:hypothetical protein
VLKFAATLDDAAFGERVFQEAVISSGFICCITPFQKNVSNVISKQKIFKCTKLLKLNLTDICSTHLPLQHYFV